MTSVKAKPFTLPPLPYDENALAPTISAKTMNLHHGKHHKAYVDKLNKLIANTEYAEMSLEEIVKASFADTAAHEIFNNAGQTWNHTFFWSCLSPNGGGAPKGPLAAAIEQEFGDFDTFKATFAQAGVSQFGSGWVWLTVEGGKLAIEKTPDAETPMAEGRDCILTIDVWEHAYYLDYQNRRADFLHAVIDELLNWDFAADNFARAGSV